MTYKEMLYILKSKIYNTFTTTYLLNESKDSNMDYLKVRNILLNLLDKDTYYDFNNSLILEDNSKEIIKEDILNSSIFLIKSIINELIIHTTYYPKDIKKKYLEFLNMKEDYIINYIQKLKKAELKLLQFSQGTEK